jgi:hypothetical protein
MTDLLPLSRRPALPDALRHLVETIPRESWAQHPHFGGLAAFWMDRHGMFRQILDMLVADTQARIGNDLDPIAHRQRLQRLGGMLVGELHMHHNIEDMQYFPKLRALQPSLDHGFDLLEGDHAALDGLLAQFTSSANGVLTGETEPGAFLDALQDFAVLMDRHLTDEEDLIVPVLLKHGVTG